MQTLRTEIIETQKVRSDLLKWKLLIVAFIGGAALGFSGSSGGQNPSSAYLALSVIPIGCFYVDLLCRHLSLRNKAIGLFISFRQEENELLREYERFYDTIFDKGWGRLSLESLALVGCTVLLSVAIVPIGIAMSGMPFWPPYAWPVSLFYASGGMGVVLSLWLQARYQRAAAIAQKLAHANGATDARSTSAHAPGEVDPE
jgi:hypothetical protein